MVCAPRCASKNSSQSFQVERILTLISHVLWLALVRGGLQGAPLSPEAQMWPLQKLLPSAVTWNKSILRAIHGLPALQGCVNMLVLHDSNNRNVLSHRSGGWFETKVSAALVPS